MSATDKRDIVDANAAGESLNDTLKKWRRNTELDLRVAAPGTVVAYNPLDQTAQVTVGFIAIQNVDTPVGNVETPLPPFVVPAARVAWRQGATHSDFHPIVPGDTGLLIFADRALDQWILQGGAPVDPVHARAHDLADAIFIPGLAPTALQATPPVNPAARTIEAPLIALGAAATEFGLRGTTLNATLATARTVLAAVPPSASPDPATITAIAANKTAIIAIIDALAAAISTKVQIE